jgi:hypothetical protein
MRSRIGVWSVALGVTGFVCGFFGPIVLNPSANQGPMLGIFITGPGGAVLGAVLGALTAALNLGPAVSRILLTAVSALGGLTILFFCLPEPEYQATLLDLELRECVPALSWRETAFALWSKRLEINSWATPPPNWRETFEREAASGSVVTVSVSRRREILRGRAPWNKGVVIAADWSTARSRRMARPNDLYVPASCAAFPSGTKGIYLAKGESGESYPPIEPSRFLDMLVLGAVPDDLRAFAQ